MFARTRSLWITSATLAYIALAAAQSSATPWWTWLALPLLPILWIEVWRRTRAPRRGEDRVDPSARAAFRAVVWGSLMWVAARLGPAGSVSFDAVANLGTGVASVASLVALARIRSPGGLLAAPAATRSLDAAAFSGLIWGIATSLPGALAILSPAAVRLDPLTIDYATTAASIAGLLLLIAAAWRLRWLRRLEVGVGDRASAALALATTVGLVAIPAAVLDLAPPDRVLPATVLFSSLLCTATVIVQEPTWVSSALRGILAVMILGAPATLVSSMFARALPTMAPSVVLGSSALAIAIGIAARAVARPLAPEQSRWLDAIDSAGRGALQPEPDSAIRAALESLRATGTAPGSRPELWRFSPAEVLSVDIAGYLHVATGEPPPSLTEVALREPERTIRTEALQAVQVRRPDVRPLLQWFEARGAFSATLVLDEDGPLGFLLMPRGARKAPMTLEEARAIRILADRISALLAVSSALARSRERELAAHHEIATLSAERTRLATIVDSHSLRHLAEAKRWARRVRTTSYSPAARVALDKLCELARQSEPIAIEVPAGSDAIGWAAMAHLASTHAGGPFVVVDGTSGDEHAVQAWEDDLASPWSLAEGGTLVVTDIGALPNAIQELLAMNLNRTAPAAELVPPPSLIVTTGPSFESLVERRLISPVLARWLRGRVMQVPTVTERAEDLRALLLDAATRWGLRSRGTPIGADASALRQLIEHPWPGNELEIDAVLLRAVSACDATAVSSGDLERSGFTPLDATDPPRAALSDEPPVRRAPSRRR